MNMKYLLKKSILALLLPLIWGLDGVLYSMPVSDLFTFLVAVFLIIRTYKELSQKRGKA